MLALVEIAALAVSAKPKVGLAARAVAAVGGVVMLTMLYETAEHGGEVVSSYAGNVGLRSGNADDVRRLLVAGLYHRGMQERTAGRSEEAARHFEELGRQRTLTPPAAGRLVQQAIERLSRDSAPARPGRDAPRARPGSRPGRGR